VTNRVGFVDTEEHADLPPDHRDVSGFVVQGGDTVPSVFRSG